MADNPLHDKNQLFKVLKSFGVRNSGIKQDYSRTSEGQIYNRSGLTAIGFNTDREVRNLLDTKLLEPCSDKDTTGLGKKEILKIVEANRKEKDQEVVQTEKILESEQSRIAKQKLQQPELLIEVHKELSKTHLKDDKEKMLMFLTCCTAYLEPAEQHKSVALKADRSTGKDNAIKTCFKHLPEDDRIFLTNATQATMEDDIQNFRVIAYSEVNLKKDDKGANAHLLEVIKQMTEGGTSSLKKDLATGYRTTKHTIQKQKTVLYGTTESDDDDELGTRFIICSIKADPAKIKAVNDSTIRWFAGKRNMETVSWIANGIKNYLINNEVVLPFAEYLPENFFDNEDSRSMRDSKRFLSIVCAITWLHQLQRKTNENGEIIGEPYDLLAAMIITRDFFNYTYSGLGDQRLQKCLDAINKHLESKLDSDDTFDRRDIQEVLGVSTNTIKAYLKGLSNLSIVGFHHKDGNEIIYKRYQKGVNKVLMGVNWSDLLTHFNGVKGVNFPENTGSLLTKLDLFINKPLKVPKGGRVSEKIDTLKLTPSELIHLKCAWCGETPCVDWHLGKPVCQNCYDSMKASGVAK